MSPPEMLRHIEDSLESINESVKALDSKSLEILIRLERGDARFDNQTSRITLLEKVVFGAVGLICTIVVSSLIYLVIKK